MRNLKRALSLALAAVMLIGMMALGTSAASVSDFNDAGSITHTEAASVIAGLQIAAGYEDGSFRPDSIVTRAEMAVFVSKMLHGSTIDPSMFADEQIFSDYDGWSNGWVNLAYTDGVISGRGDGIFDPKSTVTVLEATTMILKALGVDYDANSWSISVMTKASELGLFGDMTPVGSQGMTRDMMAALTFEALLYSPSGQRTYTVGDQVFDNAAEAFFYQQSFPELSRPAVVPNTAKDSLGAKIFGLQVDGTETDEFGRTVTAYTSNKDPYKDLNVVIASTSATYTYTSKTSETTIQNDLKNYDYTTLKKNSVITNGAAEANSTDQSATITDAATLAGQTGNGKVVEVYTSEKTITKVVIVTYSVDTVKSITEKNGVTTYRFDNASAKTNNEDSTNVILNGAVNAGDVVTIATVGGKYYVYPTTSFNASQTAKRTSGTTVTITLDGTPYVVGNGIGNVNANDYTNSRDSQTYYVDINGFVVKVEGAQAEAPQYAMIVAVAANSSNPTLDNPTGYNVVVRAVQADGIIADYTLNTSILSAAAAANHAGSEGDLVCGDVVLCDSTNLSDALQKTADVNLTGATYSGDAKTVTGDGKLFGYTFNNDGEMVLSEVTTPTSNMTAESINQITLDSYTGTTSKTGESTQSGLTALFTSDTVFVLYSVNGNGKWSVEPVVTGAANLQLPGGGLGGIAVVDGPSTGTATNGVASLVFLKGATAAAPTGDYVYVDATENNAVLKDNKTVYYYTGIASDGSEIEVYNTTKLDADKSGLYPYDEDGKLGTAEVLNSDVAYSSAPAAGGFYTMTANKVGNLLEVGNTYVNMTDDTEVVYIADVDGIENGSKILVVMSSASASEVAAVFVYEAAPAPDNRTSAATIGSITYASGDSINVEGAESSNKTPASGATVTITLADATVTKANVKVTNDNDTAFTVTVGEVVTAGDGTKTITLTIAAVETSASTDKTFTVKVEAQNTEDYKDTAESTITVKIADQAHD